MDVRQLRYFLRIVELKSYHRASKSLRIAQPALSSQVAKLESELAVKLLVRHSRGVEPTEAGRILTEHARIIIQQFESAKAATQEGGCLVAGDLAIGMLPSVGLSLTAAVIERFTRDFPQVHLTVVPGYTRFLTEWLADGRVQIAILSDPGPNCRLEKEAIFNERVVLVAPAGDQAIWTEVTRPADLERLPLILPSRPSVLRLVIDDIARDQNIQLQIRMEVDSLYLTCQFVRRGLGYAFLPISSVEADVGAGLLSARELRGLPLRLKLLMASSLDHPLSLAGERLSSYFRDVAKEFQEEGLQSESGESGEFFMR